MADFSIDERLSHAATIPSARYFDRAALEEEQSGVFGRTWQLVGRTEQVINPGDYFTATVADEPVLVVRGKDLRLRALSNVCRHRAGPVAAGEGSRPAFRCGYHGWSYSLEGKLLGMPEFDGVACFEKSEHSLPEFRVETWGPLVFVNLSPQGSSLSEFLGDLPERVGSIDSSGMRRVLRKDWLVECNWKVYVDNYLEGYHIPIVHPSLFRELDYERYRTETKRFFSIQHAPIRRAERIRVEEAGDEAQFFWVFPNLMINVYPDNLSTNLIVPQGPGRTLTIFEWYFGVVEGLQEKLKQTVEFSDEIQLEDIAICEAVQRGLKSRTYDRGRYSVKRENGVHHFHRLLEEFLTVSA